MSYYETRIQAKSPDRVVLVGITDLHLSPFNPGSWKADRTYADLMFDCLDQVFRFCLKVQADGLLVAGDVFNSIATGKNPYYFTNDVIRTFQQFWGYNIPVLGIAGNHDMCPAGRQGVINLPLGTLYEAGVYQLLDDDPVKIWCTGPGSLSVEVSGFSYDPRRMEDFVNTRRTHCSTFLIRLGHFLFGPATKKYYSEDMFGPDFLGRGDYDVLFLGHRHEDQGARRVGSKWYVAPGALARTGRYSHDRDRRPAAVLITFESNRTVTPKFARLNVPPVEELFDIAGLEEQKREKKQVEEFIKSLQLATGGGLGNPSSVIGAMDIDDKLKTAALNYIEDAENKLLQGANT